MKNNKWRVLTSIRTDDDQATVIDWDCLDASYGATVTEEW